MIKCNGSVNSIETLGLLDGPGVRVVVFLNGCSLRCKFCHNPETWNINHCNYDYNDLLKKIMRYKTYFKHGGVTFSGGEPLLQWKFLLPIVKALKLENINVAIDTAGIIPNDFEENILKYVDTILLDVKAVNEKSFKDITGGNINDQLYFINIINKYKLDIWIRQVIIPGINDTIEYMDLLLQYIKKINNVRKVELLGYHNMAINKYKNLNLINPLEGVEEMDLVKLKSLQDYIDKKF